MTKPVIKAGYDDVIQPPSTMAVEIVPKIVLYRADGTPLRRPIGYKP